MKSFIRKSFSIMLLLCFMFVGLSLIVRVNADGPEIYSLYSGELTEGDYIIYYNGKAMKNEVSSNRLSYAEVTPVGDNITTSETSIVWHIAKSGDYWTIYNAAADKYAASNGTKNQAALQDDGTDDKSLWTVSGSSTYEFVNKNNDANSVNSNLRNNNTYGFACYSDSTGGALSLYKLTESKKITFNSNGGSGEAPDTLCVITNADSSSLPENSFTKSGYTFVEWNTSADGNGTSYDPGDTISSVTEDIVLYVIWEEATVTYTVTFNSNGGSSVDDITDLVPGDKITAPTAPTKTNYGFGGWYKEVGLVNLWDFENDTVTENTTLYAKWLDTYTITFNSNGGSDVDSIANVVSGDKITAPTAPTKPNYGFGGWYKEAGLVNLWDFENDTVTENTTLYAKWLDTYTITFNSNGGSEVDSIANVVSGDKITAPTAPTKPNYGFGGWYKEAGLVNLWDFENDTVTENTTLYAKWLDTYTITFNSNGGSDVDGIANVVSGEKITEPNEPTKSPDTFVGWYKEVGLVNMWDFDNDTVTEDTTLYAKWSSSVCVMTLSSGSYDTDHITWTLYEGGIVVTQIKGSGSNVNSNYISAPRVYKGHILQFSCNEFYKILRIDITYNGSNRGNDITAGIEKEENTVTNNTTAILRNISTVSGGTHVFKASSGSGISTIYIQNTAVTTNTQLHPTSIKIIYEYTNPCVVSFNANTGTGEAPSSLNVYPGSASSTLPSNTFTKSGYTFVKWNTSADGTGDSYNPGETITSVTEDIVLYAIWEEDLSTYTVTFDSDGGSSVGSQNITSGGKVTEPSDPTKTGFNFVGWFNGEDEWDFENDTVSSDLTLTAHWIFSLQSALNGINAYMSLGYRYNDGFSVDSLNSTLIGVPNSNYDSWSGKTSNSQAVYAGNSATGNSSIQLRSNNSNSGIIQTVSGGIVTKIVIKWNSNTASGRTLDVYGKNTPYTSASDLYDNEKGTKLGSIVCGTSTELTIDDDYEFVGLRSKSGAMYIDNICIVYSLPSSADFRLRCGIDSSISTVASSLDGATYGIEVATSTLTKRYASDDELFRSDVDKNFVVIDLEDALANTSRLSLEFTCRAYIYYNGVYYYSSETKTYSIVSIMQTYLDLDNAELNEQIAGLRTILTQLGLLS